MNVEPLDVLKAEQAYLFRHGMLRDAAYALHLPSERGRLHGLALAILELVLPQALHKPAAAEMAVHALRAREAAPDDHALGRRELHWLELAADHARERYRGAEAVECYRRIAAHPSASDGERSDALLSAGWQAFWAGNRETAAQDWHQAVRLAEQAGDLRRRCSAMGSLADFAAQDGRGIL